ncbi:MAG: sugar phosphate isomerase/epimerase family protein [Candidatus Methanomethylophilaceae archaeon]
MISVSSTSFSAQSIESVLEAISKEFQHWEIFAEGEHYLPSVLHQFGAVAPSYDLKYSIHAPISDVNVAAMSERMREAATLELMATMECAIQMEVDTLTVHPGYRPFVVKGMEDKALMRAAKSLRTLNRVSREFGVRIAVENMPEFFMMLGKTAEELEALLEGTDLGVCFDIGHAHTTGQMDQMLALQDRFVNVHIHDNNGSHDEHLTIGEGQIDFESVLSRMKGYKGNYVIEIKTMESAILSRDRLQKMLD